MGDLFGLLRDWRYSEGLEFSGQMHGLQRPRMGKRMNDNINYDLVEKQARRIAEVCLVVLIVFTALYFGLGNYLADAPEPQWWVSLEDNLGIN